MISCDFNVDWTINFDRLLNLGSELKEINSNEIKINQAYHSIVTFIHINKSGDSNG